ncbi:MAG: hypothetical protein JXQ27_07645 [Acidobacteria bacterium]|nr:hypothetical protein [Acidobacteriota bacterium]
MKPYRSNKIILLIGLMVASGAWAPGAEDQRVILKYDQDTVREVSGAIQEIRAANWYDGDQTNYLVRVVAEDHYEIWVDAGLESLYEVDLQPGQRFWATGSLVEHGDTTYLLASKVAVGGGQNVEVRGDDGVPMWIKSQRMKNSQMRMKRFHYQRGRHGGRRR